MTTLRTAGYGGSIPYPVPVTSAPRATMIEGYHGLIDQGTTLGLYWTQPGNGAQAIAPGSGRLAIAFGAETPGDVATLRIAGVVDIDTALSATCAAGVDVAVDVPIGFPIPAGRDLFAVYAASPADPDAPPKIDGVQFLDGAASGAVMVAEAGAALTVGALIDFTPIRGHDCHPASVTVILP